MGLLFTIAQQMVPANLAQSTVGDVISHFNRQVKATVKKICLSIYVYGHMCIAILALNGVRITEMHPELHLQSMICPKIVPLTEERWFCHQSRQWHSIAFDSQFRVATFVSCCPLFSLVLATTTTESVGQQVEEKVSYWATKSGLQKWHIYFVIIRELSSVLLW